MLQTLIQKEQNEIKGTSTSFENAVQKDNPWVKAVYVQNAPFHIMIVVTNFFFLSTIGRIALIFISVIIFMLGKRNGL